jgi:hypothetical protein
MPCIYCIHRNRHSRGLAHSARASVRAACPPVAAVRTLSEIAVWSPDDRHSFVASSVSRESEGSRIEQKMHFS